MLAKVEGRAKEQPRVAEVEVVELARDWVEIVSAQIADIRNRIRGAPSVSI